MSWLTYLLYTILGTGIGPILSFIPSLHVYNVLGIFLIFPTLIPAIGPTNLSFLLIGMVVAYGFLNTLSSVYLGAADDSTVFVVFPGQKYLMAGKGHEAVILTGIGGLVGVAFLVFSSPLALRVFPLIRILLTPHLLWILVGITAYMFMTEFPRTTDRPKTRTGRLWEAWRTLLMGFLVFFLSGLLGFIMFNKPVTPVENAFQNLLPVFVGLFAIPWMLVNFISKVKIPTQYACKSVDVTPLEIFRGSAAGCLGGMFAAFFPMVTGGIGAFLAGHATAQRGDHSFLISQGANKVVYYVGSFLLLFVPTLHLTRGGAAWVLTTIYTPKSWSEYYMAVSAIAISGAVSFLLLIYFSKIYIRIISKISYRKLSLIGIGAVLALVYIVTGIEGILVSLAATGIGLMAILFHTRRMNLLGCLLFPMILDLSGYTPVLAQLIGIG